MGATPADEIDAAIEHDLSPTINDLDAARELEAHAAARGRTVCVHLKIDSGMNRLGVRAEDAPEAVAALREMKHLVLEGAYTHFACAESEDQAPSREQMTRLQAALARMRAAGAAPLLIHAANSAAILMLRQAHFDMVRSGLALYGIAPGPAPGAGQLLPALTLKSQVAHLKRVRRGEGVSYGQTWKAPRDSLIGVLPIGYADGYRRHLSNCGQVRVAGRLCPVVGIVCMDATLVDLTDVPDARVGMPATLIEADPSSPLSVAAVAGLCGTIPYEILTGISARVPRVYVNEHAAADA
jgi:alanine racemase